MVELIKGKKYRIISLCNEDFYVEDIKKGSIGEYIQEDNNCLGFKFDDYNYPVYLIKDGIELEELPPIENEAATMEMMDGVPMGRSISSTGMVGSIRCVGVGDTVAEITKVSNSLLDLLKYKNKRYGNSGLNPIRVFSKSDADTGLLQRIDDKIARIQNSPELRKNDVADLMGYLTLLCVSKGWDNFDEFKD